VPLSFTKNLTDLTVAEGKPARFEVEVTGGTKDYTYTWKKDGAPISGADKAVYEIGSVEPNDKGNYSVQVTDSSSPVQTAESATAALTVKSAASLLFVWDRRFAITAFFLLLGVFCAIAWPLFWLEVDLEGQSKSSQLIAVHLVIAALVALFVAAYVALLEFRGRARIIERATVEGAGKDFATAVTEVAKALPESLKAFGTLTVPAALMVVALFLAGAATALAWHNGAGAGSTGTVKTTGTSGRTGTTSVTVTTTNTTVTTP
jgi:hypothetical protein